MTPRHGAHRAATGARHGAKAGSSRVAPPGRPVKPARILACWLADGARPHSRSPARLLERSDAVRLSSALDATRRQTRRARFGQRGAFWKGGANGSAAPFGTAARIGSATPWLPLQLGPGRSRAAAPTASSSGSVAPLRNGGGIGSAAPCGTAARTAARRHGCRSNSARGTPGQRPALRPPRAAWHPRGTAAELAARRLSERQRGGQRGAIVAAPAQPRGTPGQRPSPRPARAAWRPFRTAAELATRRPFRTAARMAVRRQSSPRPVRAPWHPFGQLQLDTVGHHLESTPARPGGRASDNSVSVRRAPSGGPPVTTGDGEHLRTHCRRTGRS
jgi:hypothetical protein